MFDEGPEQAGIGLADGEVSVEQDGGLAHQKSLSNKSPIKAIESKRLGRCRALTSVKASSPEAIHHTVRLMASYQYDDQHTVLTAPGLVKARAKSIDALSLSGCGYLRRRELLCNKTSGRFNLTE
jgi:hypothetical protein